MTNFTQDEWGDYFEATKDRTPAQLLVEALAHTKKRGAALDIGAGALRDTRHLLAEGFSSVLALDADPRIANYANDLDSQRLSFAISPLEAFTFTPNTYDMVNAQSSLFFAPAANFTTMMESIKQSLVSGGIFTGNLVGENDGWKEQGVKVVYLTRLQAEASLAGLHIHKFEESDSLSSMATGGEKRWHLFNFIAEKP